MKSSVFGHCLIHNLLQVYHVRRSTHGSFLNELWPVNRERKRHFIWTFLWTWVYYWYAILVGLLLVRHLGKICFWRQRALCINCVNVTYAPPPRYKQPDFEINCIFPMNTFSTTSKKRLLYLLHHPSLILTNKPCQDVLNKPLQRDGHLPDASRHLLEYTEDSELLTAQGQPEGVLGTFRVRKEGQLLWVQSLARDSKLMMLSNVPWNISVSGNTNNLNGHFMYFFLNDTINIFSTCGSTARIV